MKISATAKTLKVSYRLAGVSYGEPGENGGVPFEETLVEVGTSFDLPAQAVLINVVEMGGAPQQDVAEPGAGGFAAPAAIATDLGSAPQQDVTEAGGN